MLGMAGQIKKVMGHIVKQPTQAQKNVDVAVRFMQGARQRVAADVGAAKQKAEREQVFTAIDRLLLLELLESDIKTLKENPAAGFSRAGMNVEDIASPNSWVLSHVHPVQRSARDIQANLRRLAAVDGVDAAIYGTLGTHLARVQERIFGAALVKPDDGKVGDIDGFLVYGENLVVRHILEKIVRRYGRGSAPFELSRALADLSGELSRNHMNSLTRLQELYALWEREPDINPVRAHYQALFAKIDSSN